MRIRKVTLNAKVQLLFEYTLMSQNSMFIAHIHQTVLPAKWRKWTRSLVFKPTASTSPVRNTILRCTPHPLNQKPWEWDAAIYVLSSPPGDSAVSSSSRTTATGDLLWSSSAPSCLHWYNYFAIYSSKFVFNLTNRIVPGTKTALYQFALQILSRLILIHVI